MDFREREFAAIEAGDSTQGEIAETFQVRLGFVRKILKLARDTGSIAPKPHRGGQDRAARRLIQAVKDHPNATLRQLAKIVGVSYSTSATDRMLRKQGIT